MSTNVSVNMIGRTVEGTAYIDESRTYGKRSGLVVKQNQSFLFVMEKTGQVYAVQWGGLRILDPESVDVSDVISEEGSLLQEVTNLVKNLPPNVGVDLVLEGDLDDEDDPDTKDIIN